MCLVLVFTLISSPESSQITDRAALLLLPISLFTSMSYFTMFEFFANDRGIRESLKNAWDSFTSHFSTLAIIGLMLGLISWICTIFFGMVTVLIQSGFDMTALSNINYITPSASLGTNVLFVLMNGIAQIVITPFSVSTFALAYVKYAGVKTIVSPGQMQQ